MKVEIAQTLEQLEKYAEAWDTLALAVPHKAPTLSYAWVVSYFKWMLLPGERWLCFFAVDNERLKGVLPLVITSQKVFGNNQSRIRVPQNDHIFSVDFLSSADCQVEVYSAFIESLLEFEPKIFDFALMRIPDNSPTLEMMQRERGFFFVRAFAGNGSYLKLESKNYEDYFSTLGREFRKSVGKSRRRYEKLQATATRFYQGDEAGLDKLSLFMELEASGWKGQAGTAIQKTPTLVEYYSSIIKHLSRLGWMEFHFLEAENEIIAGHLAVRMEQTLFLLKIAYSEKYSFCSPGSVLKEKVIMRAYELKDTEEINFVSDMPWHSHWKADKRNFYDLWLYPRRPLPLMRGGMRKIKNDIRELPLVPAVYRRLRDLVR